MALTDKLTAIADAIRGKTGNTASLTLEQMPTEIAGIKGSTPQPACEVKVIPASTDSYYLNHEHLPEIPANVEYPYLLVRQSETTITLWTCKSKMFYEVKEDGTRRITIPDAAIRRTLDTSANAWVIDGQFSNTFFNVHGYGVWSVWWANYDIPKGSADATDIYWYASTPQAEQPADATHFYYNGIRLPEIPVDRLESLPYAFILYAGRWDKYYLVMSAEKYYHSSDLLVAGSSTAENFNLPFVDVAAGDWISDGTTAWNHTLNESVYVVWSNYNIPDGSASATEIHFQSTLAVPDPLQGGV